MHLTVVQAALALDTPIPVGDFFDVNIQTDFHDHVKGAFWANFLSKRHVNVLGGPEMVAQVAPCYRVERLSNGGLLMILSPSPVPENKDEEKVAYAKLREFLRPVTVSKTPSIPPSLEKTGKVFRKSYNT